MTNDEKETILLSLREKMFHKIGRNEPDLEKSDLNGLRMDKTNKNIGLKELLNFKENECSTVDYLRCYKQRIYFIEFSDLKPSVLQMQDDISKLESLNKENHIDKKLFKRLKKDIFDRQLIEIIKKIDGSERIFERLSYKLNSKTKSPYEEKQHWKRYILIVYRNPTDRILFEFLESRLNCRYPKISLISTNELKEVIKNKS
jgi:hypothetical protein